MKMLRNGQSKLVIIANNCPAIRKTQLEYMAILGGSKVLHFDGNNVELGKSHISDALKGDLNLDNYRHCRLKNAQSVRAGHSGPWRFGHPHRCRQLSKRVSKVKVPFLAVDQNPENKKRGHYSPFLFHCVRFQSSAKICSPKLSIYSPPSLHFYIAY